MGGTRILTPSLETCGAHVYVLVMYTGLFFGDACDFLHNFPLIWTHSTMCSNARSAFSFIVAELDPRICTSQRSPSR